MDRRSQRSFYSNDPTLRALFEAITHLGDDILFLVVLIVVFVSYDKDFARRLFYVFFIAVYATDLLKEMFNDPRPPTNDLRDDPSSGYGLPSGHTTTAITFCGYPIVSHDGGEGARRLMIPIGASIMVLVPISRLVIGAHDLQDVVAGALISLLMLMAFLVLQPRLSRIAATWSLGMKLFVGTMAALVLWGVGGLILAASRPDEDAVAFAETGRGGGLLLGCVVGFPLESAYIE